MPSKNYITVSSKLTDKEFAEIEIIATRENMSVSAIIKLCLSAVINGEITMEKGELKIGVDTHNHADYDDFELDNFRKRAEKKFNRLREREYPEEVISMMKEEILAGIDARIDMLPKKFDRRKIKDNYGGC